MTKSVNRNRVLGDRLWDEGVSGRRTELPG